MGAQFPVTQGFIPSWRSAEIDVSGSRVVGMKSCNWSESCEGDVEFGNGPVPLGVTVGEYKADVEIEQLLSEYAVLLARLGTNYRAKGFNIGVQFNEPGVDLITVEFRSVRLGANAGSWQGNPGATIKWKAQVFEPISINGLSMIQRQASGASFSIGGGVQALGGGLVSAGAGIAASIG